MTKLEELKSVRDKLGAEFTEFQNIAEAAINAKRSAWCDAIVAVQKVERFAELDAEWTKQKEKSENAH